MKLDATAAFRASSVPPPALDGRVLGTGVVQTMTTGGIQRWLPRRVDVTAGATLLAGATDVARAVQQLVDDLGARRPGSRDAIGLVGFVRNGDAWDAVQLLVPKFSDGTSPRRVEGAWNVADFEPVDDLVAVWQISGFEAHRAPFAVDTMLRTPESTFPTGRLPEPSDDGGVVVERASA